MKNRGKGRGQTVNKDKGAHCSNVTVKWSSESTESIHKASSNTKSELHPLSPTISHLSTQQQLHCICHGITHCICIGCLRPTVYLKLKNWALMVHENEHQFGGKMATLGWNCGSTLVCLLSSFSIVIIKWPPAAAALQSIYSSDTINWNRTLNYADKQL